MAQTVRANQNKKLTTKIACLFPKQGDWTESDYFRLPETNRIVELSEGRLIITPSPTEQHQMVLGNLFVLFKMHIRSKKLGKVLTSPMDVRLYEGVIRQPDIVFMSNEHNDRTTEELWGVPDLVVEILSKGTIKEDREKKFKEYQNARVQEYWIVDPFKKIIAIYTLENGTFELFGKWGQGEIAKSKLLTGFEVSVDDVMEF